MARTSALLRAEFVVYHMIIVPLVAFLPAPLAYGVAVLRGDFRYWLDKDSREEITYVLKRVLGDQLSPKERCRVTRDFFRVRSCETVDVLRLIGKGGALARLVEIHGLEHIEAALVAGKGVILGTLHFGSDRCCMYLLSSLGFPINIISRWSYDEDHHLTPIRRFFGRLGSNVPVVDHLRRPNIQVRLGNFRVAVQAANALRRNEIIFTMLEAPVIPEELVRSSLVDFLNGQASMLPGAIKIAQLTGAPVLMVFMRRSADWRHQVLEISPPISMEGDPVTAFQRCVDVIDMIIRRDPAHYRGWKLSYLVDMGLLPADDNRSREQGFHWV